MLLSGWLFDVYEDPVDGLAVWLLGDDGQRRRLRQAFPITFYASGAEARLKTAEGFLAARFPAARVTRTERRDVFAGKDVPVVAVEVARPADVPAVFRPLERAFPDLIYGDVDLQLSIRYAARTGLFPLARCRLDVDSGGRVVGTEALDSPWDLERLPMPLRICSLEPDNDPGHAEPRCLIVRVEGQEHCLTLGAPRAMLINLRALLLRHDPDLLLAARGDTWMLPWLLDLSEQWGIDLPLNRDPHGKIGRRKERWYFSYGQLVYRGEQVLLSGRWHIDRHNAMLWDDYDLEGVLELARVTCLPVQTAARVSPGTGISSVQMLTALNLGVLVPWQKQQAEEPHAALDLFTADQGGLVYQPKIGLHRNVGGLDFVSMYPAIMVNYNISPETVSATPRPGYEQVPELNLWIDRSQPGLVPQALLPLLNRRVAFKQRLSSLAPDSPEYKLNKKRASALKWLLVTCFGYLGYRNARFGRIEAHQAVTAYGREALLHAKEVVEERGYEVIQMYVDGLWVTGGGDTVDFQPVLDEILTRSGLPVGLDGVYRWVAFLPSRVHPRRAAANRYFGVFQDGSVKVRGIEARRRDTAPFISETQLAVLETLARHIDPADGLTEAWLLIRQRLGMLRRGRVRLENLLLAQKMGREVEEYKARSRVARAVAQLHTAGKTLKPGQRVRYLLTLGSPGVWAWDLPTRPPLASLDLPRYEELVLRAAGTVIAPVCGIYESQFPEYFRLHASPHEFDRYTAPTLPGTARPKPVKIRLPARAEVVGKPLPV
jgi:DNA polymerase-2